MTKPNIEMMIGCMSLEGSKDQPKDQIDCIIEKCPRCDRYMWVSKRKRIKRDKNPGMKCFCLICCMEYIVEDGGDPMAATVIDLAKVN